MWFSEWKYSNEESFLWGNAVNGKTTTEKSKWILDKAIDKLTKTKNFFFEFSLAAFNLRIIRFLSNAPLKNEISKICRIAVCFKQVCGIRMQNFANFIENFDFHFDEVNLCF